MIGQDASQGVILIVDDSAEIRETLKALLESNGYSVLVAKDGREAVKVAIAERPDLILMDLFMPNWDGFFAAREIHKEAELKEVPLVAVSAYGELGIENQLQREAQEVGFREYLAKPFDSGLLLGIIGRLLSEAPKPA